MREALEALCDRIESLLDGNGVRPWSEEYLRSELRAALEEARETLNEEDD